MDDFFCPPRDLGSVIQVPYLPKLAFDRTGQDLLPFHEHRGAKTQIAAQGFDSFMDWPANDIASLIQGHLFFGLISDFLEEQVDPRDFVSAPELEPVHIRFDSNHLHDTFVRYKQRISALSEASKEYRRDYTNHLLVSAAEKAQRFEKAPSSFDNEEQNVAKVMLSVEVLIACLRSVYEDVFSLSCENPIKYSEDGGHMLYRLSRWRAEGLNWDASDFRSIAPRKLASLSLGIVPVMPPGARRPSLSAALLLSHLTANGWCRSLAVGLCRKYSYWVVNYLARLTRTGNPRLTHTVCTEDHCVANNINLSGAGSYTTSHTTNSCHCSFISVSSEQVAKIIDKDGVPLICARQQNGFVSLSVVKMRPWSRFTALSHVWSDGLGNATGNALPRCQVDRILCYIRQRENIIAQHQLSSPKLVYFWMDTLCIPVLTGNEPRARLLKSKAISRIAPVFAGAVRTLVIDSTLTGTLFESHKSGWNNDKDVAAKILCSSWMTRSWTLQEAVLARSCCFSLASIVKNFKPESRFVGGSSRHWRSLPLFIGMHARMDLVDIRTGKGQRLKDSPLMLGEIRRLKELVGLVSAELQDDKRWYFSTKAKKQALTSYRITLFVRAWNTLRNRSTSQPEDRHGILANLLDFNAENVLSLSANDRMPALIRSCAELPMSILYNRGPRLSRSSQVVGHEAWVPLDVGGDPLIEGGILRKSRLGFELSFHDCPPQAPAVYFARHFEIFLGISFMIVDQASRNEFVVEPESTDVLDADLPAGGLRYDFDVVPQSCFIVDQRTGSKALAGYLGTGAHFRVCPGEQDQCLLQYIQAVTIWTKPQWLARPSPSPLPGHLHVLPDMRFNTRLTLDIDSEQWTNPLTRRRPLYQMTHNYALPTLLLFLLVPSLYIFSSVTVANRVITNSDAIWTKELNQWIGNLSAYLAEDPDAAQIKEHGVKWNGDFHVDWLGYSNWLDIYSDRYDIIQSKEVNATLIEGYNAAWMDRIFNSIRYIGINRTLIERDSATWINRHLNRSRAWIGDFEITWLGDFNATWTEQSNATFIKSFNVTYFDKVRPASACMSQFRSCGIKALGYPILLWTFTMSAYIGVFSIVNYALWSTWQATFNSDWQGYSRSAVLPHLWEVCRFVFQDLLGWLGRLILMSHAIQWRRPWASAASWESIGYELVSGMEREGMT